MEDYDYEAWLDMQEQEREWEEIHGQKEFEATEKQLGGV